MPGPTPLTPWPFTIFSKSRINRNVHGLPSLLNTCAGTFLLYVDSFKCTYTQATCIYITLKVEAPDPVRHTHVLLFPQQCLRTPPASEGDFLGHRQLRESRTLGDVSQQVQSVRASAQLLSQFLADLDDPEVDISPKTIPCS
jgi:hypothetical protein